MTEYRHEVFQPLGIQNGQNFHLQFKCPLWLGLLLHHASHDGHIDVPDSREPALGNKDKVIYLFFSYGHVEVVSNGLVSWQRLPCRASTLSYHSTPPSTARPVIVNLNGQV